ncbi:hypothetical protein OAG82_04530, partial [Rubripirellula sp.]|nr:hypothetical protein [Rubripirellula sp.]
EVETFELATTNAAYAALDWASGGVAFAMNRHNADPAAGKKKQKQNKKQKSNSPKKVPSDSDQVNGGGE